jgi:hypothetical protein
LPPYELAYLPNAPNSGLFSLATFIPNVVSILGFLFNSLFFLLEFVFVCLFVCFVLFCFIFFIFYFFIFLFFAFVVSFACLGTLCGDDLGVSLKLPPPFECVVDLFRVLCHPPPLLGIFSCLHHNELSMPPSDFDFR